MSIHELSRVVRRGALETMEVLLLIPALPFIAAVLIIEYIKD